MSIPHDRTIDADHRIDVILAGYWQAREARQSVDRQALCARHPECASQLADFFADLDLMERIALPLRAARPAADGQADARAQAAFSSSDTVDDPPAQGSSASDSRKIRCPNCQNPIPLAQDSVSVVCPGCGNVIVLRDAQFTNTASEMKSLGKFQLLVRLGLGTFGEVWKARDTELDRVVALKIPSKGLLADDKELERFQREARAAAQLRHPNIVSVFEVTRLGDLPVIVAEFVEGVTLKEFLEVESLTFPQAAALLAQLADALEYAHTMGVVHRDIKPGNIMLLRGGKAPPTASDSASGLSYQSSSGAGVLPEELANVGRPMVLDFGLALRDTVEMTLTIAGVPLGTPAYMSPEQAAGHGHKADRRSDVYSLGVVLYMMLAGRLPFRGSQNMLLDQVLHKDPEAPRKANANIPRDLETICLTCLHKEPGRRYQSAAALGQDLRRFLVGEPIAARRITWVEGIFRWMRRRPAVAGLMAASVVAALACAGAILGWHYNAELGEAKRKTEAALAKSDASNLELAKATQVTEAALKKSDAYLYLNRIVLAEREWSANNVGRAEQLLEECPKELRGWEWNYLKRMCHAEVAILRGHTQVINAMAYHPEGQSLVTLSSDRTMRIWNALTGAEIQKIPLQDIGFSLAWSPMGDRVAVGYWYEDDNTVTRAQIFNAATWRQSGELPLHKGGIYGMAFSPDGLQVAAVGRSSSTATLWDIARQSERTFEEPSGTPLSAVAFSRDGRTLAVAVGDVDDSPTDRLGWISLWDLTRGKKSRTLKGHEDGVLTVAFSPDGRLIASGSRDQTIRIWDYATGQEFRVLHGHTDRITCLDFGQTGLLASASYDGSVRVWDPETGSLLRTFRGHTGPVNWLAFNPQGNRLASGGNDCAIKIWDATIDPDSRRFPTNGTLTLGASFGPDGKQLAASGADGVMKIFDALTGRVVATPVGHGKMRVWSVQFSPDGRRLLSASEDSTAAIWDTATGQELVRFKGHGKWVQYAVFSPDGERVATSSGDKTVKVWDARTGHELATLAGHTDRVGMVAYRHDGSQLASCSSDKTARIWDPTTGAELARLVGHTDELQAVTYSADGKWLATGGIDLSVRIWNTATMKTQFTLLGHTGTIYGLAFTPDGQRLASASLDQTVKIWDLGTGQELLTLRAGSGGFHDLAFSPDGKQLAAACHDGTLRVWDATPR